MGAVAVRQDVLLVGPVAPTAGAVAVLKLAARFAADPPAVIGHQCTNISYSACSTVPPDPHITAWNASAMASPALTEPSSLNE